jgi:predicted nucleic acid-binding protein
MENEELQELEQITIEPTFKRIASAHFVDEAETMIDCTVEHKELGEIPYTAVIDNENCAEVLELLNGFDIQPYTPPSAEEMAIIAEQQAKAQKAQAMENLSVEVDGLIFDADEQSQVRMNNAITAAQTLGLHFASWKLANNEIKEITLEQLKQAQALAIIAVGEIITGVTNG